ncbi:uncharacterized protein LOC125241518 [Leguminivora glycinivorella]|uniref:uncharacterized protein LOC125241518 n=1 Tax=Leguminivora glycinivorella TaxID=1035111 RepID=UPI00200EACB5|nr:uncharacterized protein LOC125241518 [Leguminivora glycinivorella]
MSAEELRQQLTDLQSRHEALQAQLQGQGHQVHPEPTSTPATGDKVCKVSVKLPPFWADKPKVWFAQAECQFHVAGITSDMTKFSHVISIIDQKLIGEIEDLVLDPPKEDKYETLKKELIRRLAVSEQERVDRLVSEEELGDNKPSTFLRRLRSLAGTTKDETLLRQLWMRRLPTNVQAILAAHTDLSLEKLAGLADNIIEVSPGSSKVNKIDNTCPSSDMASLKECIEQLTMQVASLAGSQARGRSRNRSSSRTRSRNGSPTSRRCWYHRKYGTKATKCISPCNWEENSNRNQ